MTPGGGGEGGGKKRGTFKAKGKEFLLLLFSVAWRGAKFSENRLFKWHFDGGGCAA